MFVAGFGLIFFGLGNGGAAIGLSNLWEHGGFFTLGVKGFFFALALKEGLAPRTITEDYQHYDYLKEYIGEDMTNENFTIEDFQGYNFFFT